MKRIMCKKINNSYINKEVTVFGWVQSYRNFGKFIFVEIKDMYGTIQVLAKKENQFLFNKFSNIRNGFCLKISGIVQFRPLKQINIKSPNGRVEILAQKLNIINSSDPNPLDAKLKNNQEIKLKFRYLDLRNSILKKNILKRHEILYEIRKFMNKNKFIEIETPILTKSTPEGAQDYLIPSRIYKNKFFALPQSPQIFKQLLMIAGFDKYYQIAKCFRDEDIRSNRQPEFTQLDVEVSFITTKKLRSIIERLIKILWKKFIGVDLPKFSEITYSKAIKQFGSEKPDLRNPLKIVDVDKILITSEKNKLIQKNKKKNRISTMCILNGKSLSDDKFKKYFN